MGEFLDLLLAQTENGQGKIWLEDFVAEEPPAELVMFRASPFNHENVQRLRDFMAGMMNERLAGICTEELYKLIQKRGHAFLQEIGELSASEGVDFGARGTDRNVTFAEILQGADIILVVDGKVQPKKQE